MSGYRSGFASLVGRPNVGKSTLLNGLVGQKLAIVSDKPQTTRNRILGVVHRPGGQAVILDTPGWQRPRHRLGTFMLETTRAAVRDVDAVLLVVDGSVRPGPGDAHICAAVSARGRPPVVLVVNKTDLAGPETERRVEQYSALHGFHAVVSTVALKGEGLDRLEEAIFSLLPQGPEYFPPDMVTDQPERVLVGELVREQVLRLTHQEVPHSVAVLVEDISPRPEDRVYIRATVFVERESQKGIIIGRGGSMLRDVGAAARLEIERVLGSPVYLDLHVKVVKNWRDRAGPLRELGLTRGRD